MTKLGLRLICLTICSLCLLHGPLKSAASGGNPIAVAQKPEHSPQQVLKQSIPLDVVALSDPTFHVREMATSRLIAHGSMAIEELLRAVDNHDAETAWRAKVCIQAIVQHDEMALGVLENLASSQSTNSKALAEVIIQREQIRQTQIKKDSDPDAGLKPYFMSEKARAIERNLGFD